MLPTRTISSVLPPRTLSIPRPHAFSRGVLHTMGFMLAPIQSRVTIPLFRPASPFEGRSSSFSLALSFSSLVLRIPFNSPSTPPSHPFPPLPHRHLYIARKFRTPQTRGSSRISRVRISPYRASLPCFFPPSLPLPLSFRPWHPSVLSGFLQRLSYPDIYVYSRAFRFNSFRCTRISPPPPSSPPPPRPLSPSSFCSLWFRESTFERSVSLSPLYLFLPGSRHTRSPRSFCPVPFHHRCRAAVPSLTPFVARPSSPRLFALLYRAAPPHSSTSLTPAPVATPSDSILVPLPLVRPRFLALSDARSSRSRPREAQGEKRVRFYKWFQPRTGAGVVFRVIGRRLCHAAAER